MHPFCVSRIRLSGNSWNRPVLTGRKLRVGHRVQLALERPQPFSIVHALPRSVGSRLRVFLLIDTMTQPQEADSSPELICVDIGWKLVHEAMEGDWVRIGHCGVVRGSSAQTGEGEGSSGDR